MVAVSRPDSEIRALRTQDLDAVAAMEADSYEFPWSRGIFADCLRAGHPCWVLWVRGEIAGYGILSIAAGEAHILNLCIGHDWRGMGLGRGGTWGSISRVFARSRHRKVVSPTSQDGKH